MSIYSDDIIRQAGYNDQVSRYDQMPWQVSQKNQDARAGASQPLIIYTDALKNPLELVKKCREISDEMYLGPHPLFGRHNPNQPYLYDAIAGKLRRKDYETMMRLFGDEPAIGVKDNHFFHGARQTLKAQVLSQPFEYSAKNVNTAFAQKKIIDDSKKGAQMAAQSALRSLAQQGDGAGLGLINPRIKLPQTPDDWLNYATGQEQLEGVLFKILQDIDSRERFQDMARAALDHKFAVNAEFGFVDVANGQVLPQAISPQSVRWLSGKQVQRLDDASVMAVQYSEYMTPQQLVNHYGVGKLATGTGVKGVLRYIDKLFDQNGKQRTIGYNPTGAYWSGMGVSADMGNYCLDDSEKQYTTQQINWMNNAFYPVTGGRSKKLINILVQHNYFTMLREKRFTVEKIERGVRSPATDREIKQWQTDRANIRFDLDFTPVDNTSKLSSRQNIKTYVLGEQWQFKRIGHDGFIDIGPYPYQPDFQTDTHERHRPFWPIVGQISYEKSMAALGETAAVRANVITQKIDMALAAAGYETALIVDEVQGKSAVSWLYNARQTGVLEVNSNLYTNGNPAGMQHLKTVQLGNQSETIKFYFDLIRQIKMEYETAIGAGPDVQGVTSQYASNKLQQQNIVGQKMLNVEFNYEHSLFMNQLLQASADIGKFFFARDEEALLVLSQGEVDLVQLTTDLSAGDYRIRLESGVVLKEQKDLQDQIFQSLIQSGGAEYTMAILEAYGESIPAIRLAKFRQIKEQMDQRAQQAAQSGQETAKLQSEDAQKARDHQLLLKQIDSATAIQVANIKAQSDRASEEFQGVMSDIQAGNSREDAIFDAQQQAAQSEQEAAQQAKLQAQSQAQNQGPKQS